MEKIPKNKDSVFFLICIIFLFIIACVSGIMYFFDKYDYDNMVSERDDIKKVANMPINEEEYSNYVNKDFDDKHDNSNLSEETFIADDGTEYVLSEIYSSDPMKRAINWRDLYNINSDIIAWIYIPGTPIDYPILREPVFEESFYLKHNVYRKAKDSGSIFTPRQQDDSYLDMHLLLYGHHMKNGTMFGSLTNYKNESFYELHPFIYVYYPDRTEKYNVWTVEHVKDDHEVYLIPYIEGSIEYTNLIDSLEANSIYDTSMSNCVLNSDKTIVLSTCDNIDRTGTWRFIVCGVLSCGQLTPD